MGIMVTACDLCCGCRHKEARTLCVKIGHKFVCRPCLQALDAELEQAHKEAEAEPGAVAPRVAYLYI